MSEEKQYLSNGSDAATKTAADALEFGVSSGAKMVDLKFTDLLGTWQHVSLPITAIDEDAFEEGLGFDGSSIRGWKGIQESDMLLIPDPNTAVIRYKGKVHILKTAPSADGARYVGDGLQWWTKGMSLGMLSVLKRGADYAEPGPECVALAP